MKIDDLNEPDYLSGIKKKEIWVQVTMTSDVKSWKSDFAWTAVKHP